MTKKLLPLAIALILGTLIWTWQQPEPSRPQTSQSLSTWEQPPAPSADAPPDTASSTVADTQPLEAPPLTNLARIYAFRNWAKEYLTAPQDQRAAMLGKGRELANAHTKVIAEMIRQDPEQAIANAVPMVVRQDLPLSIVDLLENRVNMKASLDVYGNVPLPGAEASPDFQPYTRSVTKDDGSYWNAFVYGARASQRTMSVASLNGISVGRDMAVAETPARLLETGERPNPNGREIVEICPVSEKETIVERTTAGSLPAISDETPALETAERIIYVCSGGHIEQVQQILAEEEERAHWESMGVYLNAGAGSGAAPAPIGTIPGSTTTGHRRFLYLRATFPENRVDPQSEAECQDMLRQMADYISQTSYGRCYFTYAVAPLVVLPYPESWYLAREAEGSGGDTLLQGHARTIAKAMGYDYLLYDLDAVRWAGGPGSYGGSASVGGRGMRMKSSSVGTFCHELGHNLGVWHANYWRTTPPSSIGPGNNAEYGNIFDVMGSSGSLGQFTAHFKNILNWLPNETHWTVNQPGTYRIHQFDYASADPSFRYALRIKKDTEREYWAEFRQRLTTNTGFTNGLMMTWDGWGLGGIGGSGGSPVNGSNRGAQLLDMTPGSFGNGITDTRNDSALWVGRTFSDHDTGIHVTPIAKNTSTTPPSMDVYVSLGAVPGNLPPSLAISASSTTAATNGSITLTATASDLNADPLAYAWVFGDGTYSTNNSPSQTKSWTTAGHYQVLCTASDMKGGRTTRSILVTVGTPTTFNVSGNITGPDSLPLEGVYVANYAPSNATSHPNSSTFRGTWTDSAGNYTLTGLTAGSYTISPNLYPNVFAPSGFANPVTVGPNSTGKNFTCNLVPSLTLNVSDPTANEGATPGPGTIRLERTGSTANALAVQIFNTNTGTATRTTDYSLSPAPTAATSSEGGSGTSQYTIPAGAAFLDITVTPVNDSAKEGTEYAALNFANTSGGYILAGSAVALVDIIDDDGPTLPVVKLTHLDNVASENSPDPATLKLERNGDTTSSLTVFLTLAGTAMDPTDYAIPTSVVIPAGSAGTTLTLTPVDDSLQEETETTIITIATNAAYARDTLSNAQTITIHDNDQPTVSLTATDTTATETAGNSGIFTITRTGGNPYQALTVDYAIAGRAVHGVDYRRLDGRATILAGASSTTVEIQPFDDTVDEGTQDVIFQIRSTTAYRIEGTGIATLSITDNDAPQVYLKLTTSGVTEPATGSVTGIAFQIIRPASGTAMTVNYAISGTATSGTDFTALPGTIAFASGDTSKTINVTAVADTAIEDAETVTMTLLPGTGYTLMASQNPSATGFILDGDQPTVDVSAADTLTTLTTQGTETSANLRFMVARKVSTASDLVVNYTMSGTAIEAADYTGTTGSVTIPSGAKSAFITIVPVNDTIPEGVESITLDITPAPGTYGLRTSSATILLGDNDAFSSGSVGFVTGASTTSEIAGTHNIAVNITGSPAAPVVVNYRVSAGTAIGGGYDFTLPDGTLTFPLGTTSLNIPVTLHQDLVPELAETIAVQLYNPTGGNLGTATHTITINNLSLPEAFTDATSNLLANSVTLNGRTLPNGLATDVWFQYGPTSAYGSTTTLQAIGSGTASVNVTAPLSGFAPGGYHFRLVAQNSAGITYGINQIVPSNNADLASLVPSAGTLFPAFSAATIGYTAGVSNATTSITVTPTRAQADATLRVNGTSVTSGTPGTAIPLAVGITPITILVTAQDGTTTKTYTLSVTREALPFVQWQTTTFGNSGSPNADPGADPDFDGIVNTLEYVLGGIPIGAGSSDTSILPTYSKTHTAFVFTYRRTKSANQEFSTVIETTSELSQNEWAPVAIENIAVHSIDSLTEIVTATIPLIPGANNSFARLKVEPR